MTTKHEKDTDPWWKVWYRYVDEDGRTRKLQCHVRGKTYEAAGKRLRATFAPGADITILGENE